MCMRGIYRITNRKNGKYYVGSSSDIAERWNEHRRNLDKGIHINPKLQRSWKLHSSEAFEFTVLEEIEDTSRKILLETEQKYLDIAKSEPTRTYNIKFVANGWDWESDILKKSIRRGSSHANYDSTIYTFSHLSTGQQFVGTRCDFYTKYGLQKKSIRLLTRGAFKQVKGWVLETSNPQ